MNTINDIYQISLSRAHITTGQFAKVSMNKKDMVDKYKWYLGKNGYPFTFIDGVRIQLHRYIWCLNTGHWHNEYLTDQFKIIKYYVDHINRDKLDATDGNLRLASPAENSRNKIVKSNIIDPISMKPLHNIKLKKLGYEVCVSCDGKPHKIDKIGTLEEAKQIYNMMANELFGVYAVKYDV